MTQMSINHKFKHVAYKMHMILTHSYGYGYFYVITYFIIYDTREQCMYYKLE